MLEKLEIINTCIHCDSCHDICPENAIYANKDSYVIDNSLCIQCGFCLEVCPVESIKLIPNTEQ